MFELLKALMALNHTALDGNRTFNWNVSEEGLHDGNAVLKVDIALSREDVEFIEQFRQLVGA